MRMIDLWTWLAIIVTVFVLPLATYIFYAEQRKERENEIDEVNQSLSDAYIDSLKLSLQHSDLKLRTKSLSENRRGPAASAVGSQVFG